MSKAFKAFSFVKNFVNVLIAFLLILLGFSVVYRPQVAFSVMSLMFVLILLLLLRKLARSADNATLMTMLMIALLLRIVLATVLHFLNVVEESDALFYHREATSFANILLGLPSAGFSRSSNAFGYIYMLAFLYAGFGPLSLIPKIINCFIGVACGIYIYKMALKIWNDDKTAMIAAGLALFLPGILIWSTMNLRDVWVTLFILISVWHMFLIRMKGLNRKDLLILLVCFGFLWAFRFYIALLLTPIAIFTLGAGRKRSIVCLSILIVLAMLVFGYLFMQKEIMGVKIGLEEISRRRASLAAAGGSSVGDTRSVNNTVDALKLLPSGMVYLFFYPLPWSKPTSLLYALAIPEMLVIYLLMAFTLMGIYRAIRNRVIGTEVIFFFLISSSILYAISAANIGTTYRMRMPIFLILFIFTAGGLRKRERLTVGYIQE